MTTLISGSIYKIVNTVDDMVYIGSTKQKISVRMAKHRASCKRTTCADRPLYKHMNLLGIDKFRIVLVEAVEVKVREEMLAKEYAYQVQFDTLKTGLNAIRAHCTSEMKIDNHRQAQKEYSENNNEKIKQYRLAHPEQSKQSSKKYQQKSRQSKKYYCEKCKKAFPSPSNLTRHNKTQRHLVKTST